MNSDNSTDKILVESFGLSKEAVNEALSGKNNQNLFHLTIPTEDGDRQVAIKFEQLAKSLPFLKFKLNNETKPFFFKCKLLEGRQIKEFVIHNVTPGMPYEKQSSMNDLVFYIEGKGYYSKNELINLKLAYERMEIYNYNRNQFPVVSATSDSKVAATSNSKVPAIPANAKAVDAEEKNFLKIISFSSKELEEMTPDDREALKERLKQSLDQLQTQLSRLEQFEEEQAQSQEAEARRAIQEMAAARGMTEVTPQMMELIMAWNTN